MSPGGGGGGGGHCVYMYTCTELHAGKQLHVQNVIPLWLHEPPGLKEGRKIVTFAP